MECRIGLECSQLQAYKIPDSACAVGFLEEERRVANSDFQSFEVDMMQLVVAFVLGWLLLYCGCDGFLVG